MPNSEPVTPLTLWKAGFGSLKPIINEALQGLLQQPPVQVIMPDKKETR